MNRFILFFINHRFISLHIFTIIVAFLSFQYLIERLLFPVIGMGWAYVIDQTIPLIIAITVSVLLLRKRVSLKKIRLEKHYLLLCLIFIVAIATHLGTLNYFFWSDEVVFMLEPITQNIEALFHTIGGANMRGYFISSYAFLYLVFGTTPWVYPLFSVIYLAFATIFVYWFIYLLTKNKLIATLSSLFFATTPAYLDMFTWHSTAHAPILIFGLVSFISLLYYKKTTWIGFYFISLMFFFVAIKMGFIRSAGFTLIPFLLLLLPLRSITKQKLRQLIILALPYIMITLYFCLFEFLYREIEASKTIFEQTGNIEQALNRLLGYRGAAGSSALILPKLSLYTGFLFVPSGLAGDIFPPLRPFFGNISIALTLGNLSILALLFSFFISLKNRHSKNGWLILFAVIFIFINMLHSVIGYQAPPYFDQSVPGSAGFLDERFTREDIGYGPGSRYLFISSVGVSLLFALLISWLTKRGKILFRVAVILGLIILLGNTYYTVRAQVKNFKPMNQYKALVADIFKLVPRDGKPKILYSANPEKNGLDNKFGNWIYGFYKKNEFIYTKDPKEVERLIKKGLPRDNLYAFYNNPHTFAFKDISHDARNYFFGGSLPQISLLSKFPPIAKSSQTTLPGINVNLIGRGVIESQEINQNILLSQNLKFELNLKRIENLPLPLSDTILSNLDKKYTYNIPLSIWGWFNIPPRIINNPSDIKQKSDIKTAEKQSQILNILKKRESLMNDTIISVSNIKDGENITKESIFDEVYTTYPNIRPEENFFFSKENSVVISLYFPFATDIGRVLLNTPSNYSANSPEKITIFSSFDGYNFEEIINIEDQIPETLSPNRGRRYHLDFPKTKIARALQIEIKGDKPVVFDEIVIDGEEALNFSPKDIYETARNAYNYVDNEHLLQQLATIRRFDRLTVLWACADDTDWQEQLKNKQVIINGIWNISTIILTSETNPIADSIPLNCYGARLRKVFFISPPYPVEMELIEAKIE